MTLDQYRGQASTDEDDRLRTVRLSNRPPHGRIRTLDQHKNFNVDEWTNF